MSAEIQVDDETRAALLLFNERLAETAAEERAAKRIAKAERAKDEAAKRVRQVNEDLSSSPEQIAEAEAAYKAAVAELARVTENPDEPAPTAEPSSTAASEPESSSPAAPDDAEPEPAEISADEEPPPPPEAANESE